MKIITLAVLLSLWCPGCVVTHPFVGATVPAPGETHVATTIEIVVSFSEMMDMTTVRSAFSILPDVPGSVRTDLGNVFVFVPASPLDTGTTYTVRVAKTARSARSGRTLAGDHEWSFTTWDAPK